MSSWHISVLTFNAYMLAASKLSWKPLCEYQNIDNYYCHVWCTCSKPKYKRCLECVGKEYLDKKITIQASPTRIFDGSCDKGGLFYHGFFCRYMFFLGYVNFINSLKKNQYINHMKCTSPTNETFEISRALS